MEYLTNLRLFVTANFNSKMSDIANILKPVTDKYQLIYSGAIKKFTFGRKTILSVSFAVPSIIYDSIDLSKLRSECQKLQFPSLAISNVSKCMLIKDSTDTSSSLGYRIQIEFLYTLPSDV